MSENLPPIDQPGSILSEEQKNYLVGLAANPLWNSILDALAQHAALPVFTPGGDGQKQYLKWVFDSGRMRDREQVLMLLTNGRRRLDAVDKRGT